MPLAIDAGQLRDIDELENQQIALIKVSEDPPIWTMGIKINDRLLYYFGGKPFLDEPIGWLPMNEN